MTVTAYTVRGKWPFPTDMLRRDDAVAATPSDQAKIDDYSQDHGSFRTLTKTVDIDLVAPRRPNTARWESFGWTVPTDEDYQAFKKAAAAEARRKVLKEQALTKLTPEEREVFEYYMTRAD